MFETRRTSTPIVDTALRAMATIGLAVLVSLASETAPAGATHGPHQTMIQLTPR